MAALDLWLAPDKLGHLLFCAAVTAAAFSAAARSERWASHRLLLAAVAGVTVGVGKEVGDALGLWPGAVSARDLGADAAGVAAGLALAWALERRDEVRAGAKPADELV